MSYRILVSDSYLEWLKQQDKLIQAIVDSRIAKTRDYGHFGITRHIESGLCELKFKNGIRLYFYRSAYKEITFILGGSKHGQKKDIKKAKAIFYK